MILLSVVKRKNKKNETGAGYIFGSLFILPIGYLFFGALISPNSDLTSWSGWVLLLFAFPIFSLLIFLFIIPAYKENHFRSAESWAKAIIYWAFLQFFTAAWIFATGTSPSKASNYMEIPREVGFQPLMIAILCFFVWGVLRLRINFTKMRNNEITTSR